MKKLNDFINDELLENDETFQESLLDDEETLIKSVDNTAFKKYGEMLYKEYPKYTAGYDAYGRKLEVGDWVIYVPTGAGKAAISLKFGIIGKLTPKKVQVIVPEYNVRWHGFGAITGSRNFMNIDPQKVFKITNKDEFVSTL